MTGRLAIASLVVKLGSESWFGFDFTFNHKNSNLTSCGARWLCSCCNDAEVPTASLGKSRLVATPLVIIPCQGGFGHETSVSSLCGLLPDRVTQQFFGAARDIFVMIGVMRPSPLSCQICQKASMTRTEVHTARDWLQLQLAARALRTRCRLVKTSPCILGNKNLPCGDLTIDMIFTASLLRPYSREGLE